MTRLQGEKGVTRIVSTRRGEELVVTMTEAGLVLRKRSGKGMRTRYGPLDWARLFLLGAKLEADLLIAERKASKKAKQEARRAAK